jgi:filamentous hemagglutinin family protein
MNKPLFYSIVVCSSVMLSIFDRGSLLPLAAQPIVPAQDGTQTQVLPNGDRYDILGGTRSSDGTNLFHSFERFGLDPHQTANFLATPELRNIFGRIIGGDPSLINGLLQLSGGTANLYLMNPAGIVFGPNASLNVPADFTATAATGIGFGNGMFNSTGAIAPETLNGSPTTFWFETARPGAIINAGSLSVSENANLTLTGGIVVNTGNISAPGGNITLAAVPGSSRLQLSQDGTILRLDIDPPRSRNGTPLPFRVLDLPELLTGPAAGINTGLTVTDRGEVQLTSGSIPLPTQPGTTIVSNRIDTRSTTGHPSEITVLGDNIALLKATIDASIANLRIGGDYRGEGDLPTAHRTFIDAQTTIDVGNGGFAILWADEVMGFAGTVYAPGGFVEVSGGETLLFQGFIEVGDGTILLDPRNITIADAPSTTGVTAQLPSIFASDFANQDITINRAVLEALSGNLFLEATDTIRILDTVALSLQNSNLVTFVADYIDIGGSLSAPNVTLIGNKIDLNSVQGTGIMRIETLNPTRGIQVGGRQATSQLDLSIKDVQAIAGFQELILGNANSINTIELQRNDVFNVPVTIAGAARLIGPDRDTTWTFTGPNSGTISGFANGVTFNNIGAIEAGFLEDRFVFKNGINFQGSINGGFGYDTFDYSGYGQALNLNLATWGASRINQIIAPESFSNTLTGSNNNNDWQITGTNTGTLNGIDFRNFERLIGGSDRDTFTLGNNGVVANIDGGGGSNRLVGPNQTNTWNLSGTNSGIVNNRIAFQNIQNLTGGRSNDTFVFADGARIDGVLDGNNGRDTLDYRAYRSPLFIDLANKIATGTQAVLNLESLRLPTSSRAGQTPTSAIATLPTGLSANRFHPSSFDGRVGSLLGLGISRNPNTSDETSRDLQLEFINRNDIDRQLNRTDITEAVALIDSYFSFAFADYLGQTIAKTTLTFTQVQEKLTQVSQETATQPAIIYTFIRSDRLDLILVPPSGDPQHYEVTAASPERLKATIEDLQFNLLHPTRRRSTSYLTSAQQLYEWIITPLEADLKRLGIDTLLFSLDTGLRTLPLAVLHDGEQFLIENYRLSIIPSLYWLNTDNTNAIDSNIVAMGMSEFTDQKPLPAVQTELAAIASKFGGNVFLNEAFTLDNLQQQPNQQAASIVHLATHGEFLPGKVDNSYIQLWDRKLTLAQMRELQWTSPGVALLVLSACRTALGDSSAEYGFAGLGIQTGANSVLASLWYASDTGTLALMSEFYGRLGSSPLKAEALRQAQLALIRGQIAIAGDRLTGNFGDTPLPVELENIGDRNFSHPYYWAGFSLIGSPW